MPTPEAVAPRWFGIDQMIVPIRAKRSIQQSVQNGHFRADFCGTSGIDCGGIQCVGASNPETYPMPKSLRRRCDAHLPFRESARDRAVRSGELAKYLRRTRCKNWAVRGSKRCRLHGGFSTGPITPEGKARTIEALKAGRARWLARLKSEGKPIPCGRKKRGHNRSAAERQLAQASKQHAERDATSKHFCP
jgi:hypothetical protein